MSIKENIEAVRRNILTACQKSGRNPEDILLLAVSKTIDIPQIKEAVNEGLVELGENKPQEINRKYYEIDGVKWHQIGHLQTNKVKYIIDKVCLVHSLDSLKLAEEISKRAEAIGIKMDVLVEINIAGEEAKHGVKPEEAEQLAVEASKLPGICVKGLMTVAPFDETPENNRKYFRKMHNLFVDIAEKNYDNIDMKYLSMGMTNDYMIAVEEGANILRVGTGIFGARNYAVSSK
jgi:pyridoxal phosphate enzyme (YggS family)